MELNRHECDEIWQEAHKQFLNNKPKFEDCVHESITWCYFRAVLAFLNKNGYKLIKESEGEKR